MMPRPIRARSVSGMALKVFGALLASYVVSVAWLDREAERSHTVNLKREMDYKQRVAASHDGYAEQLKEMQATLSRLMQRLPSNFDLPAIEKTLHDQATQTGVEIASMQLGKERSKDFYADLPMDLIVRGTAIEFVKFMDHLLSDSPLRQITEMKIEPTDKGAMRAAISAHFYRYVEDGE